MVKYAERGQNYCILRIRLTNYILNYILQVGVTADGLLKAVDLTYCTACGNATTECALAYLSSIIDNGGCYEI